MPTDTQDSTLATMVLTPTTTIEVMIESRIEPTPSSMLESSLQVFISEVMINPQTVNDSSGEYIELYNADTIPVNLDGWILTDKNHDLHMIEIDFTLNPGEYVVLARNGDTISNGGVATDYVYSNISLANNEDALFVLDSNGQVVDQIVWNSETELSVPNGSSLERTNFDKPITWTTASSVWLGSNGDIHYRTNMCSDG